MVKDSPTDIVLDRMTLPVLYTCEVVVVGGSFGGVAAALALARAGRKVALVEARTYLGREVTATLRPWVSVPIGASLSDLPHVVRACVESSGTSLTDGEVPLWMRAVKVRLEDLLLQAGVRLFYASLPVGLCVGGGELQGVIIGNKSGRQVMTCQAVLDASATALVARLAGAEFEAVPGDPALFAYTVEFDGVGSLEGPVLSLPGKLGIVGDRAIVHRGYRGKEHVLLGFEMRLPGQATTAAEMTQREIKARQKAVDVAAHLLSKVPAFQGAHLAALSYEPCGTYTPRMAAPAPRWAAALASLDIQLSQAYIGQRTGVSVTSFAGPTRGIWCLNEAARVDQSVRQSLRDPLVSSALGNSLARILDEHWEQVTVPAQTARGEELVATAQPLRVRAPSSAQLQVRESDQPRQGQIYSRFPVERTGMPVAADVDVLVAGGGTSGAMAAIVSAREGMRTTVVDMNPGLGGTGTYGGVDSYWCGHHGGFVAEAVEWVDRVHDYLRQPRPDDLEWPKWNIEAKTHAWLMEAQHAGVELLSNALVIGTIVEGEAVRGIVVATRTGPMALLSKVVIDATGDGDVAAFAGAEYTLGSTRDHSVMWYSLPQFARPGRTWNNFTSMVDVSNVADATRAILSARRRGRHGPDSCHDHGVYIATRESRHIWGDVVLTVNDHLLHRCWPDCVYIAFSNNDIKGQISSDWMRIGLIPPHVEIEIPYRVLLPRGLENILVAGKAVSTTRDSLSAIRMQADLENLGGVAGLAAAMATREGKTPRAIDVSLLQVRLVEIGALSQQVLGREVVPLEYSDTELETLVDGIAADPPLHAYSKMELHEVYLDRIPLVDACCAGPRVIPVLAKALEQADGPRRTLLAQALTMVGSSAGVPVLVAAIQEQLAGDRLPTRDFFVAMVDTYAPDQGAMPEAAYLLYSLGIARDRRALPVWQRVVDLLQTAIEEDVWSQEKCLFHYVDAVCIGAEQLGDPAAIPILKQLHRYAPFRHKELLNGFQAGYLKERAAYLEVVIGRALARCGSPDGVILLINYLNDVRANLAEQAHDHLVAVTGQDFGNDTAAWSQWLEMEGDDLKPVPWMEPTDPLAAWGERILIRPRGEKPTQRVQVYEYKIPGE
jgi:ribulose 1,5-bisphosphate synthetase/thiazole synthase